MLASDVNAISPRGPREYLSIIWMDYRRGETTYAMEWLKWGPN
jgi:hypothetical protein